MAGNVGVRIYTFPHPRRLLLVRVLHLATIPTGQVSKFLQSITNKKPFNIFFIMSWVSGGRAQVIRWVSTFIHLGSNNMRMLCVFFYTIVLLYNLCPRFDSLVSQKQTFPLCFPVLFCDFEEQLGGVPVAQLPSWMRLTMYILIFPDLINIFTNSDADVGNPGENDVWWFFFLCLKEW